MNRVLGVFRSRDQAEVAVRELRQHGFDKEISVVAKEGGITDANTTFTGGDNLSDGAATGGVVGGLAGLALGAGTLAIPGIGPIIAAGPIAGLISGAITGGIAGGLIDWGIPRETAERMENEVKSGNIVVGVECSQNRVEQAAAILKNHGAESVEKH